MKPPTEDVIANIIETHNSIVNRCQILRGAIVWSTTCVNSHLTKILEFVCQRTNNHVCTIDNEVIYKDNYNSDLTQFLSSEILESTEQGIHCIVN